MVSTSKKQRLEKFYKKESLDVVILCGGKGTRFETVSESKPKVLANIKGKPYLDIIIESLENSGFKRFILAVGYRKDQIINYVKNFNKDIILSIEDQPLGTGGALKAAKGLIKSENFLVMNGDVLCNIDYKSMIKNHLESKYYLTMAVSKTNHSKDYGNISIARDGRVRSFLEKNENDIETFVNAGTYLMNKNIFKYFPCLESFSLEVDFFQKNSKKINPFIIENNFLDIGTPEKFKIANNLESIKDI